MTRLRLATVVATTAAACAAAPAAHAQGPEPVTDQDRTFLVAATESNLLEIATGRLAQRRGDASVKPIGRRLVRDHTLQLQAGATAAQQLGITGLPTAPSPAGQAIVDRLAGLRGNAFDRAFLRAQRVAHRQAINLFVGEATSTGSATLRTLAIEALPVLGMHLGMVVRH